VAMLDWTIVAVYAVLTLAVGVLASRKIRSMSDYLVAGRAVKFYLGVASLTGTEMGVISMMGLSELGYTQGFTAVTLAMCFFLGVTFVGATGFIINGLRRCMVMTIPEFYGRRYNQKVRWLAGFVMSASGVLNMGMFLKVSALFFASICGLDVQALRWVMGLLLLIVLVSTLFGGMVSVVLMDYFQYLVLVTGVLIATCTVIYSVSFLQMYDTVAVHYALPGFSPFADTGLAGGEVRGWPFILMNLLVFMCVPALWQPAASRALSASDPTVARRTTLCSGLTFLGRGTLPIIWGIAALAYFSAHPGQLAPETPPIAVMPQFLAIILPTGLIGVVVAGMFAADISTYNGYLLAWSGIITQDVVAPLFGERLSERVRLRINRVTIVLIGGFLYWMGLFYTPPATFLQYQQLTGTIYLSGAFACVMLGLYWKGANTAGAVAATLVGALFPIANLYLQSHLDQVPDWIRHGPLELWMTNGWYAGLSAFGLALVAMIVTSLATGRWIPAIDPRSLTAPPAQAAFALAGRN
jgi:SSS family solute:Na+ symporter